MIRQYELVERVKSYDPSADEDMLNRAYVFSMKAHGAQLRASGDPYFSHPIEVAGILTQMKLDSASIVTALLHDTVEDTVATLEDIQRLFLPVLADETLSQWDRSFRSLCKSWSQTDADWSAALEDGWLLFFRVFNLAPHRS